MHELVMEGGLLNAPALNAVVEFGRQQQPVRRLQLDFSADHAFRDGADTKFSTGTGGSRSTGKRPRTREVPMEIQNRSSY